MKLLTKLLAKKEAPGAALARIGKEQRRRFEDETTNKLRRELGMPELTK